MSRSIFYLSLFCLIVATGLLLFGACSETENPDGENFPPPSEVCFEVETSEKYYTDTTGRTCLTITITITNCQGDGFPGILIQLESNCGYLYPTEMWTNSAGSKAFEFCFACISGGCMIRVTAAGRTQTIMLCSSLGPPTLSLGFEHSQVAATGYESSTAVEALFLCDGQPQAGVELSSWAESGCFEHGCEQSLYTDAYGQLMIHWYPPMWGTPATREGDDVNEPISSAIIVTYMVNGEQTVPAYNAYATLYIYPLHARFYVDGSQSFHHGPLTLEIGHCVSLSVDVYAQIYQEHIPISLHPTYKLGDSGTNSYLEVRDGTTYFCAGEQEGNASITAIIAETGPSDCCYSDEPSSWRWTDTAEVVIVSP